MRQHWLGNIDWVRVTSVKYVYHDLYIQYTDVEEKPTQV